MIDCFLKWSNKAAAIADAVAVLESHNGGTRDWLRDHVATVQIWRHSQDTVDPETGARTHNYLAGYYVLISLRTLKPALLNHAAVQLVIDRDKMNAREPGFVLKSGVAAGILQDIRFQPVFLGMDVPWGGLS